VEAGLAAGAGPFAAADAGGLVALAAGLVPQWSVANSELRPLMSSRMSISPMLGQLVAPTGRAAAPSIQNAGQ
jgi:hypothetical protein